AAAVLQPGERVVVHTGVYREWVKPARGGAGPDAMISYEAAPGEQVVVLGSDPWTPDWQPSLYYTLGAKAATWQAEIPNTLFEGANPFALQNLSRQSDQETWLQFPSFELRRGQIFIDGTQLIQVSDFEQLGEAPAAFWVEDNGAVVHVRLADDGAPADHAFEITTREQLFAPKEPFLGYIRVKGFSLLRCGNGVPIPPPQRGLLSTTLGHHWIIEECEIGYANAIGIDIAAQTWFYTIDQAVAGYHIIRRNVFLRTGCTACLWLDNGIKNTRVTQNLFANTKNVGNFGAVFFELHETHNLIDNNIIIGAEGNGFYEHDAEKLVLLENLIANGTGSAVLLRPGDPARGRGRGFDQGYRVFGNVLTGFSRYIATPNRTVQSDYNLFGTRACGEHDEPFLDSAGLSQPGSPMELDAWRAIGYDAHSVSAPIEATFDEDTLTLSLKAEGLERLPVFDRFPETFAELAATADLLTCDFLGRPRIAGAFSVGPLLEIPLDGTPVSVDPRRMTGHEAWVNVPKRTHAPMRYIAKLPAPREFDEGFEDHIVGAAPRNAAVYGTQNGAVVAVTDETAAAGHHCLKMAGVARPEMRWEPEAAYRPYLRDCVAICSFDMRLEAGAVLRHDWRADRGPQRAGPSVVFDAQGNVLVGGQQLIKAPRSTWFHVEIECEVAEKPAGIFVLTVTLPGQERRRFEQLACETKRFNFFDGAWFLMQSGAPTKLYLDNIRIRGK
ncbi:MAG TPA: right-handed parallel beta-helix repeat-containing protein, partial [Candidatus Hydrogenedentes bacterium]|nr:right-handed parallel beta-helix repeat-containing protein [Candidatus Hydrogenedentota bacterium]